MKGSFLKRLFQRLLTTLLAFILLGAPLLYLLSLNTAKVSAAWYDDNVPIAAAQLRNGLEAFFTQACNDLEASVLFKLSHRWEWGELGSSAVSRYKALLRQAKNVAQSWKNNTLVQQLEAFEKETKKIFETTRAEEWAINANVHYNSWVNFSRHDFEPVAAALKELCDLFQCGSCEGFLHVTKHDNEIENVRCRCGAINWNLLRPKP